jgi:hypothetical protein
MRTSAGLSRRGWVHGHGSAARGALALVVLGTLWLGGCGDTTKTHYCTYASDCPSSGPRFCINGICHSEQCQQDRDCPNGQTCVEGLCSDG